VGTSIASLLGALGVVPGVWFHNPNRRRLLMMFRRLKNQRGVTLVELMVVVAIIAIIAAIAITLYQDVQKKARLAADLGTVAALRSAGAIYYGKNDGTFATTAMLSTLVQPNPPVMQCPGASWSADPTNGVITYIPNDISAC